MTRGELRRVVSGDFKGTTLRVSRVESGQVWLQRQDEEGRWVDFVHESPEEIERLTIPLRYHCPVDYGHHLGQCCLVCGNDEREAGRHLPNNPDLTDEDRARFKRHDAIFEANWSHFWD